MQPSVGTTMEHLGRLIGASVIGSGETLVTGVRHDSRAIEKGELFAALSGATVDGHDYIDQACKRGASGILAERPVDASVPSLVVDDTRKVLGAVANAIYGQPFASLKTVGITGTNGKTTVAWLVRQMLEASDFRTAVLGTLRALPGEAPAAAIHTTPEADGIARFALEVGARSGNSLVMEVSSHALDMKRVDGVTFDVAAFTNLSQDHLDYHETMEAYGQAKERLFTELAPEHAVFNIDDPFVAKFHQRLQHASAVTVSVDGSSSDIWATKVSPFRGGLSATVHAFDDVASVRLPFIGRHNLENYLVALAISLKLGASFSEMTDDDFVSKLYSAPGRMQRVPHHDDVLMFVDYAHTPDALERAIAASRVVTEGRLWVVFGCGGDRDRGKRPLMGDVASNGADRIVVTSDNPRTEDADAIVREIVGSRKLTDAWHVEVDRRAAIAFAVQHAEAGDTILVAGKGHEDYQVLGTERVHLSDVEELEKAVASALTQAGEGSVS